jgi:hypothetical protein
MRIEAISTVVVAVVAVLSLLLNLYEKHKRLLGAILEAIAIGLPFGFVPHNLIVAVILFAIVQAYGILKDSRKPNLSVSDAFVTMGLLCLHSGTFAAFVVYVRL